MWNDYEEMIGALRNLRFFRWNDAVRLLESLIFMFAFLCLTEWKTFSIHGPMIGLAVSARLFGEVAFYGIVMVPCVTVAWLLLLKILTLDSHKLGFRLGSFFGNHADIDQPS